MIGEADLLPALYGKLLIPEMVASELSHPSTPEPVQRWIASRPSWLHISPPAAPSRVKIADLDQGERDAILLTLERKADLLLMDERDGVDEARRRARTDSTRSCDCPSPPDHFRINPALVDNMLAANALRLRKPRE